MKTTITAIMLLLAGMVYGQNKVWEISPQETYTYTPGQHNKAWILGGVYQIATLGYDIDTLAYFDFTQHLGLYRNSIDPDSVVMEATNIQPLGIWNGPYLRDGMPYLAYIPPFAGTNQNLFTNASGTHLFRKINQGITVLNGYVYDRGAVIYDSTNVLSATYLKGKTVYAADTLTITPGNAHYYNSNSASSIWVDTAAYDFVVGDYYEVKMKYNHSPWSGANQDWWIRRGDASATYDYNSSVIPFANKSTQITSVIYQHYTNGAFYWRNNGTTATIDITEYTIKHILNSDSCIIPVDTFKTKVRDALRKTVNLNYDITDLNATNIFHIRPYQGFAVDIYNNMNYLATAAGSQTDNGSDVDVVLAVANTGELYVAGDTVFLSALNPIEFNGDKVLTAADATTVTFNQPSYNTVTDFVGTINHQRYEYDPDFDFTDYVSKPGLIVYGSELFYTADKGYTPWSYSESSSTEKVSLWFKFVADISQYEYWQEDYFSNRIFGFMVFDTVLTDDHKWAVVNKVYDQYKEIYKEIHAPQIDWDMYGYWAEDITMFLSERKENNFATYERNGSIAELNDTLWLFTNMGGEFGFNSGDQGNYETSNDNLTYYRSSTDNGSSWSLPSLLYAGNELVSHAGDTVATWLRGTIPTADDSLLVIINQADTITSPTKDLGDQKLLVLKVGKGMSYRVIDPLPTEYGFVGVNGANYIIHGDTIFYPLYDGYNKYLLKSGDNGNSWSKDLVLTGDANTGNEWSIAKIGTTFYGFSRVEEPTKASPYSFYINKSTDYGITWTEVTPDTILDRSGISAPVSVINYSTDSILIATNTTFTDAQASDRAKKYFMKFNGTSVTDYEPFLGSSEGGASFPTWFPIQSQTNKSYFDMYKSGNNIHIVCDEGSDNRCSLFYIKMTKK